MINTSRHLPNDSILNELSRKEFSFAISISWENDEQLIYVAEKILQGKVEILDFSPKNIVIPFSADDIDKGSPKWRLHFAGLGIPDILLDAYKVTGRDDFFKTAQDIILAWSLYESSVYFPKGFLWNDHAISSRIYVLAKFWKIYRNHYYYYNIDSAKTILQFAARSGKFLSKTSHFTCSTNHGIMQNLSLWHLCLSFPNLSETEKYKKIAFERMRDQMTFLINEEGVILEHSPNYQGFDLQLISIGFRYMTLLNIPIPDNWKAKYTKAKDFYSQLRRPDGSLPIFGDTNNNKNAYGPFITNINQKRQSEKIHFYKKWFPKTANGIYPVAGYSIWWNGLDDWPNKKKLNQTVVGWSYYPGHGHKHADEMSVSLWARGQTWWTNIGYWPYGTKGRSEAVSWKGSNAPHLINESTYSARDTLLKYYGWSDSIALVDLERRGPKEYLARRQVVHLKPNLWVIVDNTSDNESNQTSTIWTTAHNVKVIENKIPGSYILKGENSVLLKAFFIAPENAKISHLRGSFKPFAGWDLIGSSNVPTSSIVIEQSANNSWSIAIWLLEDANSSNLKFTENPYMKVWKGPEHWNLFFPIETGFISICRKNNIIRINEDIGKNSIRKELRLVRIPEVAGKKSEIQAKYRDTSNKYAKTFKILPFKSYQKATYILILLFILQEFFFFAIKKINRLTYVRLKLLNMFGWAGIIIIWIIFRT